MGGMPTVIAFILDDSENTRRHDTIAGGGSSTEKVRALVLATIDGNSPPTAGPAPEPCTTGRENLTVPTRNYRKLSFVD